MRAAWGWTIGVLLVASTASAQSTERCEGQKWTEIAAARYEEPKLGPLLAINNRAAGSDRCTTGRFVRLIATIRHEVRLGQTLEAIASRFFRAPGAEAFLRAHFQMPEGTEPGTGRILELPVELALAVGSRPKAELEALYGLPSLDVIRTLNGVKKGGALPKGTVYVPVFLTPNALAPAPPPPSKTASGPPTKTTEPPPPSAPPVARLGTVAFVARFDRFRHPDHASVMNLGGCQLCHVADPAEPLTYQPIKPETCTRCHASFVKTQKNARTDRLALTFSHDLHLSKTRTVQEEGYEIGCAQCHDVSQNVGTSPGHKTCVKCHNPSEAKPAVEADCTGCHATEERQDRLTLARLLLDEHYSAGPRGTDIRFTHEAHLPDDPNPEFADLPCAQCHEGVVKSDGLGDVEPMRMADCLECHQGMVREWTDRSERLDRCAVCHVQKRAWEIPSPSTVMDTRLVHGPGFNRRHGSAAERDDGDCATCHVELSGGVGAECQRCHERLRPRDHSVRWREEPHGRAAVRDPERCATCHARERCIDCHNVAPRDHFPRASFRTRHGRSAQRSMRRCQTCHLPQVDCARCHDVMNL